MTYTQKRKTRKDPYAAFVAFTEKVGAEMFTKEEWDQANSDNAIQFELKDMLSSVYQGSFERNPDVFGDIRWINSDDGFPLWVRPGVNWEPDNAYDD